MKDKTSIDKKNKWLFSLLTREKNETVVKSSPRDKFLELNSGVIYDFLKKLEFTKQCYIKIVQSFLREKHLTKKGISGVIKLTPKEIDPILVNVATIDNANCY